MSDQAKRTIKEARAARRAAKAGTAPELTAPKRSTGAYVGVIGVPDSPTSADDVPFEERPGVATTWLPFPSLASPSTTVKPPASSGLNKEISDER